MATVDLVMPKLGESIMEATILKWHKQPGDTVAMDETVLEIATDKVDSEVPSTAAGVLSEILFNVNDVVPIGTVIARIKTGAEETVTSRPTPVQPKVEVRQPQMETVDEIVSSHQTSPKESFGTYKPQTNGTGNRFYSPLVLNIAASEGVSMSELENIPGTGNEGRVTKKDILQYVSERRSGKVHSQQSTVHSYQPVNRQQENVVRETPATTQNLSLTNYTGNVEIIE